ncbi:hypothetical protein AAFC00_006183 [Neodothiora populina]
MDYSSDRISDWSFDWIRYSYNSSDDWLQFMRAYKWEKTALGPMHNWPSDLRRLAVYALSSPDPRLILWGDDLLGVFNDSAKQILGQRYLACLGQPLADGLSPAVVEQDLDHLRRCLTAGTFTKGINAEYILTRYGFDEEAYFDYHISPLPGDDGRVMAMVVEFHETTISVIKERKEKVATAMFKKLMHVQHIDTLWSDLVIALTDQPKYVSYAAIYTNGADTEVPESYRLGGFAGADRTDLPQSLVLPGADQPHGLAATLHRVVEVSGVTALQASKGELPEELAIEIPERGTTTIAYVLPIAVSTDKHPLAFIVLGMNPKLALSNQDRSGMSHLRDVVVGACAIVASPEKHSSEQDLEALNLELSHKLHLSTRETLRAQENFQRMAKNAPFGMFTFEPDGTPTFVNEEWLRLSGFDSREELKISACSGNFWDDRIFPEDASYMAEHWQIALTSTSPTKHEHRVRLPAWMSPGAERQCRWLEATAFPDLDETGNIISIKGWLVDISDRKLAENLMAQRLEDALETKRASEAFIDMVSHEIRNPLSAILQLADGILTSVESQAGKTSEQVLDAAQTIVLCAHHQRKIVDDVLVLSKLDSNLLVLSPDACRPPDIIQKCLKMFESELSRAQIDAHMQIEQSYLDLGLSLVVLDESRVLQVVINLLGNAIKFTQSSEDRKITIHLAAHRSVPTGKEYDIQFASQRRNRSLQGSRSNSISQNEPSEAIYLQIAVKDTGRGLTQEEIDRLFQRFSQASPKTYKKYGGSGLGLYISKELTELQGGRIGVKSEGLGKGSVFTFYVQSSRSEALSQKVSVEAAVALESVQNGRRENKIDQVITKTKRTNHDMTSVSSLHVLVVEDNAINQKVMAQQLRRAGCTVHVANHGLEALDLIATTNLQGGSTPLSIVLMDVEMPVMNGIDCTKHIRQLQKDHFIKRSVPIIAVTANARNQQIASALGAGVDEVVTKPFRIPELLPRMEALVAKLASAD